MKRAKTVWLSLIVLVISFALVGYLNLGQPSSENCEQDCVQAEFKQASVEPQVIALSKDKSQQEVNVKKPSIRDESINVQGETKLSLSNKKLAQQQADKKSYDDDWCSAKHELNESDYQFAKREFDDWLITLGKARAGSPRNSPLAERVFPNSNLIESYESLPLEQLQDLAFQGNKWAMVTFVQRSRASVDAKNQIAKKLMVNGAFHFALEHLVLNSLLEAQTSARKKDSAGTKGYVTDALAYAYWGLQYYDTGGFQPFYAVALSERIRELMPIDSILANSVDEVNEKLSKLNQWVNKQRVTQGIEMPTPPKSVHKFFELTIAAFEHSSPKKIERLRRLDITNSERIASTLCVKSILANIREKSQ